jgi:hypothetical protein
MTQEQKDLLFKDLSARLPYHVKVKVWLEDGTTEEGFLDLAHNYADVLRGAFYYNKIKDIKPYLFPISSMTEEQKEEYRKVCELDTEILSKHPMDGTPFPALHNSQDWLDAHHFDYRGLIERGFAIDATGKNIY